MTTVVVAYVPVLHDGYRRFLERHGRGKPLFLIGPELYEDYRPLAKDIRALDPGLAAAAIGAWGICSAVEVLDAAGAARLGAEGGLIVLPDEDVSHRVADRWFPRSPVLWDSVFLRWDKTKTVRLMEPAAARTVSAEEAADELAATAEERASASVDWWRQVGAAIRLEGGEILAAANEHGPHPLSPYAVGDPRSNFFKGVHMDLSTATHAEAALVASAARQGWSTEGAVLYVTDFPCPSCAKLIAAAGVATVYFRTGYAVLDGQAVLEAAGVEIVHVISAPAAADC